MKTILFFARDPGGANVILPVYMKLKEKYHTYIYAKEFALKSFRRENIAAGNIEDECDTQKFEEIGTFLRNVSPDLIITGTSLNDFTERFFWKAAEMQNIKTFAILDQWMNLGIRFSEYSYEQADLYHQKAGHPYLPYKILVMDQLAKNRLLEEGIEEERISVTGQPHFDVVWNKFQNARAGYDRNYWNVVFVSEPISQDYDSGSNTRLYWGYNEKTIFSALYKNLKKIALKYEKAIRIIIRPHPRENPQTWQLTVNQLKDDNITVVCDMESSSFGLIKTADLVCGMSSMFLLEAVICNKPVMSIEIGLKRENPFILNEINCCRSVLSEEELYEQLEKNIEHEKLNMEFKFIRDASDKVALLVEEEMFK